MGKKFTGSTFSARIADMLAFNKLITQQPAPCTDGVKLYDYKICIPSDAKSFTDEQIVTSVREYFCHNHEVVAQWDAYRAECCTRLQEPLSYAGSFISRRRFSKQRTLIIRMSGQLN